MKWIVCLLVLGTLGVAPGGSTAARGESTGAFRLTSPAFDNEGLIPRRYTGEGRDLSPPLEWTGVPRGTVEFVLLCESAAGAGEHASRVHWLLYRIPGQTTSLQEGTRAGVPGMNSWGRTGYAGPIPNRGQSWQDYRFQLFALKAPLSLEAGADRAGLFAGMKGKILGSATLTGRYQKEPKP